jgi:hypothetical protein
MSQFPVRLAHTKDFIEALGRFHAVFSVANVNVDIAIGRFLSLHPEQTHLITAGMMFGPKVRLLAGLIGASDHPQKAVLLGALGKMQAAKREAIAHGYMWSDLTMVRFVERNTGGGYTVKTHDFTLDQFKAHTDNFIDNGYEFYSALGLTDEETNVFADAAFNLARKEKKSPDRPDITSS